MRQNRQGDERSVSSDLDEGVTREQYTQTPAQCTEQALADFGAPRGVAKPYASARPFLRCLSGIDELRVANRRVHEPRYAK